MTKLFTSPCGKAKHVAAIAFDCFVCSSNVSCGCDSMSKLHEHNFPSVEILIKLCAFCVPTTLKQYTGCCRTSKDFITLFPLSLILSSLTTWSIHISKWYVTYGVRAGGQGSALYGSSLLHSVVPKYDLAWVGTAQDQIRMESGERGGHNRRLTVEDKLRGCFLKFCVPD